MSTSLTTTSDPMSNAEQITRYQAAYLFRSLLIRFVHLCELNSHTQQPHKIMRTIRNPTAITIRPLAPFISTRTLGCNERSHRLKFIHSRSLYVRIDFPVYRGRQTDRQTGRRRRNYNDGQNVSGRLRFANLNTVELAHYNSVSAY